MMQVKFLSTTKNSWKKLEDVAGGLSQGSRAGPQRKQDPGNDSILRGESHHQPFSGPTGATQGLCAPGTEVGPGDTQDMTLTQACLLFPVATHSLNTYYSPTVYWAGPVLGAKDRLVTE